MQKLSLWMIGYGLLLIICDAVDAFSPYKLGLNRQILITGWVGGILMIAAGVAAAQGRRSLRVTGLYVGLFLPLVLAGFFAWDATQAWHRMSAGNPSRIPVVALTSLAALSVGAVLILARLRPREGIASRGYAVSIPPVKKTAPKDPHVPEARSQSKAG